MHSLGGRTRKHLASWLLPAGDKRKSTNSHENKRRPAFHSGTTIDSQMTLKLTAAPGDSRVAMIVRAQHVAPATVAVMRIIAAMIVVMVMTVVIPVMFVS